MKRAVGVLGRMVDSTTIRLDEPVPFTGRVRLIVTSLEEDENSAGEAHATLSRDCTLLELLERFAEADVLWKRDEEATMLVACLAFPNGRRLILLQRTYRQGVAFIADPTEAEIEIGLRGDPWNLWNADRCHGLGDLVI